MNTPHKLLALGLLALLGACTDSTDKPTDTSEPPLTDSDGDGYFLEVDDCDDEDATIHPDAAESCDEVDNNCDGTVDEGVGGTYYLDSDADGFGDPTVALTSCTKPEGTSTLDTDCDDANAEVFPAASEVCDGADNDCDGLTDDADDSLDTSGGSTYYADADGDGYGDALTTTQRCEAGDGWTEDTSDCDDADSAVMPGAVETCDGVDNDCDGLTDDADTEVTGTMTAYTDADADGFGDPSAPVEVCALGDGAVDDTTDCDDTSASAYPGAEEACRDSLDNDCDGEVDEDCTSCDELNVVMYYDSFTAGSTPMDSAATLLGATLAANSSEADFTAAYDADPTGWDVLVVDVPGTPLPSGVLTRIESAIDAGTVVVIAYWYLGYDSSTASVLGVSVDSSYSTPLPISSSSSGTMWDYSEDMPDKMSGYVYDAGVNGQVLSAVDPTTSETLAIYSSDDTQDAIIATYGGQVIVNGFLPWDYQLTDDDGDGVYDPAELYVNEIGWALGCSP